MHHYLVMRKDLSQIGSRRYGYGFQDIYNSRGVMSFDWSYDEEALL